MMRLESLLLPFLALAPAQEPEPWAVDAPREPAEPFRAELEEGTWISLDVSPDGTELVFDLLGHLYEMPIEGGRAWPITEGRSWNLFPRYAPDGRAIAFTSDRGGSNDLWVLDRDDGSLENRSDMDWPVFQGTWSADGRALYGTALNERVRFPAYRFGPLGSRLELVAADERKPVTRFVEDARRGVLYFERFDRPVHEGGPSIRAFDLDTGEVRDLVARPGGASAPALSRDGSRLAYVHRDDLETVLVVRDLDAGTERVVMRGLDRGRFDSTLFYGCYPNLSWHPDGRRVFLTTGGRIRSVDVDTGEVATIPFRALVVRPLERTQRVAARVPDDTTRTRSHRFGLRTPRGVVHEALGDLWLTADGRTTALEATAEHETSPVVDAARGVLYVACWSDAELGWVEARSLDGTAPRRRLTTTPAQYGSLALAPALGEGALLALRGTGVVRGARLEEETELELVVLREGEPERVVRRVRWSDNRYAQRPPALLAGPAREDDARRGAWIYFSEHVDDALTLKRVREDGADEQPLVTFPHATRAVPSPDLRWVAFREYHRSWVAPLELVGVPHRLSPADGEGVARRVDELDGDFLTWSDDGRTLGWTRGARFLEKDLEAIVGENGGEARSTDLSVELPVAAPGGRLALTGLRVLTMDGERRVLEGATVLIEGARIAAVGPDVPVPADALVLDLAGRTAMPGMLDAHGHYGSEVGALNVIEQRSWGLLANLVHGVTTMVDVYGTTQKDFWLEDLRRAGRTDGPRLVSVGDPIFVTKYRTKMHRPIESYEDALEHARFNADHGAPCLKDYSNHRRAARQQLLAACRELDLNLVAESFGDHAMALTQVADGFTGIEHTFGTTPLFADVVGMMAATDVGITPTLIVLYGGPPGEAWFQVRERVWDDPRLARFYRRDELLRQRRPTFHWPDDFHHAAAAAEMKKLFDAGVLIQMGAHGQRMGLGAHWELELLVQGGFSPLDALQVATRNGYRHHGLDRDLGSIEPGKLADLVILSEDPREDVRRARSVELVLVNGVVYDGLDGARVHPDPAPAPAMYFLVER